MSTIARGVEALAEGRREVYGCEWRMSGTQQSSVHVTSTELSTARCHGQRAESLACPHVVHKKTSDSVPQRHFSAEFCSISRTPQFCSKLFRQNPPDPWWRCTNSLPPWTRRRPRGGDRFCWSPSFRSFRCFALYQCCATPTPTHCTQIYTHVHVYHVCSIRDVVQSGGV